MSTSERIDLAAKYVGQNVRINHMADSSAPKYDGKIGVVLKVDDEGLLHGTWGGVALMPNIDDIKIIPTK